MAMIRKAQVADAPLVGACHYHCWQETYLGLINDDYLDRMNEESNRQRYMTMYEQFQPNWYVVEDEGEIIGFFDVSQPREAFGRYEVQSLYLRKKYQGQGIGRQMFEKICYLCQKNDFYLWCLDTNPTCDFYRHMGGEIVTTKEAMIGTQKIQEICFHFNPTVG